MHIVCFGDSLTWGQYGGSYPDALAAMLPQHTFTNSGVGGDTILNLLRRLEQDVIAHSPDAVLIMIGGNDAIGYLYPKTRPYYQHSKQIPDGHLTPDAFAQAYRDLLSRIQLAHIHPWVALEPGEYSRDLNETLHAFNAQAQAAASAFNIPVIDLPGSLTYEETPHRPPLSLATIQLIGQRGREGWDDYEGERIRQGFRYTFDGIHPTPSGAQLIAHLIATFIEP